MIELGFLNGPLSFLLRIDCRRVRQGKVQGDLLKGDSTNLSERRGTWTRVAAVDMMRAWILILG